MARKRVRRGECAYCGRTRPLTRDHIPPKALFGSPRPNNLISILCCRECNEEASKDDEYFKNALALRIDTYNHPDVQKILPSVIRSYKKDHKIGYRKSFFKTLRQVELRSPSGLFIGSTGAYNVEIERLDTVARRIVRGLFYIAKGERLPDSHRISVFSDWIIGNLSEPDKAHILDSLIAPLSRKPRTIIGEETFTYRFQFFDEDPFLSIWLLTFFEAIFYIGLTLPNEIQLNQTGT